MTVQYDLKNSTRLSFSKEKKYNFRVKIHKYNTFSWKQVSLDIFLGHLLGVTKLIMIKFRTRLEQRINKQRNDIIYPICHILILASIDFEV